MTSPSGAGTATEPFSSTLRQASLSIFYLTAPLKQSCPGWNVTKKLKSSAEIGKVAYADAVKRALPHATQVADHYHLVQNLREHLQRFLDRKRPCLPEGEDIPLKAVSASDQSCGGSLHDQMGTGTRTVSAGAPPAERTDQEQIRPAVPPTLMDQEVELACLTYAEREARRSAETSALLAMSTCWRCTEQEWDNERSPASYT